MDYEHTNKLYMKYYSFVRNCGMFWWCENFSLCV